MTKLINDILKKPDIQETITYWGVRGRLKNPVHRILFLLRFSIGGKTRQLIESAQISVGISKENPRL
jgi:hypothetical protein